MMNRLFTLLADAAQQTVTVSTDAGAPAAEGAQQAPRGFFSLEMMGLLVGMMVLFWFMTSRSNKKQQQKRQEMLERLKKGARVMLSSGIYGTIVEVKDATCIIEIADGVRIEAVKNAILELPEEKSADAKEKK